MDMNAVDSLFIRRVGMAAGDDVDFGAGTSESLRKLFNVPGDPADYPGRILPGEHDHAH
jgi:hypothetical protein